jgi:TorA maturation chaperone TorD
LFGGLFLAGVTADHLPWIEAVDSLTAVLPRPFDPHEAAAAHYDLFDFHLHPYAGLFLDASGLSGGVVADEIGAAYRTAGFRTAADTAPDHLGQALLFLSYLAELEADGWQREATAVAQQYQTAQDQFLRRHLLPWLFPVLTAVRHQQYPFYSELAQLTLALIMSHFSPAPDENGPIPLPVTPPPFNSAEAGLRELVRYLTTPFLSGVYYGRHDIGRIARALNLPRGFGGRETMLLNLFRSGGQYETAAPLLAQLAQLAASWQTAYAAAEAAYPQAAPYIQPWRSRAAQTAALLREQEP